MLWLAGGTTATANEMPWPWQAAVHPHSSACPHHDGTERIRKWLVDWVRRNRCNKSSRSHRLNGGGSLRTQRWLWHIYVAIAAPNWIWITRWLAPMDVDIVRLDGGYYRADVLVAWWGDGRTFVRLSNGPVFQKTMWHHLPWLASDENGTGCEMPLLAVTHFAQWLTFPRPLTCATLLTVDCVNQIFTRYSFH